MNQTPNNLVNSFLQDLFRTRSENPLTSAMNIIQRYNRNIEDYNRNIENYNLNVERIIPLLQTVVASETQHNQPPSSSHYNDSNQNVFEFTYTPSTTNLESIFLSLFDLSGTSMNRGLSEIDISMNTTSYNYTEPIPALEEPRLCPITMEPFVSNTQVMRITNCGHIFKVGALRRWFQNHNTCPLCRGNVIRN
jgi:hypothetical protein